MDGKIQQEITPSDPVPGKYMLLRHGGTKKTSGLLHRARAVCV